MIFCNIYSYSIFVKFRLIIIWFVEFRFYECCHSYSYCFLLIMILPKHLRWCYYEEFNTHHFFPSKKTYIPCYEIKSGNHHIYLGLCKKVAKFHNQKAKTLNHKEIQQEEGWHSSFFFAKYVTPIKKIGSSQKGCLPSPKPQKGTF